MSGSRDNCSSHSLLNFNNRCFSYCSCVIYRCPLSSWQPVSINCLHKTVHDIRLSVTDGNGLSYTTVLCNTCSDLWALHSVFMLPPFVTYRSLLSSWKAKSLMAKWLEQASQWHEMYSHDLEAMSFNPSRVKLGVRSTSLLSRTWSKNINSIN